MNGIILADKWAIEDHFLGILDRVIGYMEEKKFNQIILVKPFDKESMDPIKKRYPNLKIYENPFYKNYNEIYSLSLVDFPLEDTYIVRLADPLNHNIFYEFESARIFVTRKQDIKPEICYEIDDESNILDRRKTTEYLTIPVGIYFLKEKDLKLLNQEISEYLGISSLRDEELGIETLLLSLQSKMDLKAYQIPSSYME
ncbi:MAG: hypothetical protein Q4P28_04885 [Tissierellia bacterium]|nr:hypothetical protein [Tissierellia bacterium]